jgi:hypothetical protein
MNLDTSFDAQLLNLKSLNWLPWIGDNFHLKKVLLVGESHYDDGEGWLIHREATRNFVNNQGLNSHNPDFKNRRLFQNIEKTLLEKEDSSFEERQKIWRQVAYFNLVQRLLPTSTDRPTEEDYDKGWEKFLNVVDILKPSVCIKYGYEGIGRLGFLLNNFDNGWTRDDVQEFYTKPYCVNITKGDYHLKIIFVHHPTGAHGFDFQEWAEHIRNNFPTIATLIDVQLKNKG